MAKDFFEQYANFTKQNSVNPAKNNTQERPDDFFNQYAQYKPSEQSNIGAFYDTSVDQDALNRERAIQMLTQGRYAPSSYSENHYPLSNGGIIANNSLNSMLRTANKKEENKKTGTTEADARRVAEIDRKLRDYRSVSSEANFNNNEEVQRLIREKESLLPQYNRHESQLDKGIAEYASLPKSERERRSKLNAYNGTSRNSDFETNSQYLQNDDWKYNFINGNDDGTYEKIQQARKLGTNTRSDYFDTNLYKQMTEGEIRTYNYLYNRSNEEAEDYLKTIEPQLNERESQRFESDTAEYAKANPFKASLESILSAPLRGVGFADQTYQYFKNGSIDTNTALQSISKGSSVARNAISEDAGSFGGFLYQTGMSMGDFLMTTLSTGGFGEAAMGGEIASKVAEAANLALMGAGAASDSVIEGKEKGYSDNRAYWTGFMSGLAEIITEKVSVEALLDADALRDNAGKYILKNILSEGGEEVESDLINWAVDDLWDIITSQDKGEWNQSIQKYMSEGKSYNEAVALSVKDRALQAGQDFVGGALSGGVMAGVGVGSNRIEQKIQGKQMKSDLDLSVRPSNPEIENVLSEARNSSDSYTKELANKVSEDAENNYKNVRDTDLGKLAQLNAENQYNEYQNAVDQYKAEAKEATQKEKLLNKASQMLGQNGGTALAQNYNYEDDVAEYSKAARDYYAAGVNSVNGNVDINSVVTDSKVDLSVKAKQEMFLAGQKDATNGLAVAGGQNGKADVNGNRKWKYDLGSGRTVKELLSEKRKANKSAQESAKVRIASVKNIISSQGAEQVKVSSILANGSDDTIYKIKASRYTPEMQTISEHFANKGYEVTFVSGLMRTAEGRNVRGEIDPENHKIVIQADNNKISPSQIAMHEEFHAMVNGKVSEAMSRNKVVRDVWKQLSDGKTDGELNAMIMSYASAYNWMEDGKQTRSDEYIMEEILADAYAGIDVFSHMAYFRGANQYQSDVQNIANGMDGENFEGETRNSEIPTIELEDSDEINELVANADGNVSHAIARYLFAKYNGQTFNMSDGTSAIMDGGDAKKIANVPNDVRKAELGNLKEVVESAKFDSEHDDIKNHKKFTHFKYYAINVAYKGTVNEAYVNLGLGRNDNQYHLYAITKRPSTNEGVPQSHRNTGSAWERNGLSTDNLTQSDNSVKTELSDHGVELTEGTATKNSEETWSATDKTAIKNALIAQGFSVRKANKWINDVNSVAALIAADRTRLDYEAADNQVMLKNNQEYIKTLDASTLCAKRLLYQGTYNAVQHALPNTPLLQDDVLRLRQMMNEHNLETPCGVCYVESRRKALGKYAAEWLKGNRKNAPYNGDYIPTLDEVTTTDGLENLRKTHPDTYEDFMKAMKKKGTANPKVVELRTAYRDDIQSLTASQVENMIRIGGLRVQSFSDFETPHLIDMMQAVLDMSGKGLTAQAYTKVPNFAWVFGGTGMKINLSLIGGVNENGELVFDSKEGMDINEAVKIRDYYPDNVGTILVGKNDASILAAMADDRIDFIIPFHRSGWGKANYQMLGLEGYKDFTRWQNERGLDGKKLPKEAGGNLYPIDYWDFSKSGKENAEIYLEKCAELGRIPKFDNFLVKGKDEQGRVHYYLQNDGSTDGYWKMLIDYKMYNASSKNAYSKGKVRGTEQQKIQPNFNMVEANRVLSEYEGGANTLKVNQNVVDEFVKEYKEKHPNRVSYSEEMDSTGAQLTENQQKYFADSKIRDKNGNLLRMFHGTKAQFTEFKREFIGSTGAYEGSGFNFTPSEGRASSYAGPEGNVLDGYINVVKPLSFEKKTLTVRQLANIIKAVDPTGDDIISNYARETRDYGSTSFVNREALTTARAVYEFAENDVDIYSELSASAGGSTNLIEAFQELGYDGLIHYDENGNVKTVITFDSNQFKNYDNLNPTSDPDIRYSEVVDEDKLNELKSGKTVKVYRAMQVIDGKLYPPMAAKVKNAETGKNQLVEPTKLGTWYQADERPDLIDPKTGTWKLDKANGGTVPAAYNPYWHTSKSLLNDQFSSAWDRPNLVTVECEVPESELTSGYKAEYAKDAVGEMSWHSGPVSSKLAKIGNPRRVILSRYVKVNRIVSDAEAATKIADMLKGTDISIPDNTITPSLKAELQKLGIQIGEPSGLSKSVVEKHYANNEVKFSENPTFANEVDEWDKNGRDDNESLLVGTTGDVYLSLGAVENDIYMMGWKINTILSKHSDTMTIDDIKKVPRILEHPTLVLQSKAVNSAKNTRLVVFSNMKNSKGDPIMAVLDLRPVSNGVVLDDIQYVNSAYVKDNNPEQFVRDSKVLYVDKNRAVKTLRSIGFQMPIELLKTGSIGSINYVDRSVNIEGEDFENTVKASEALPVSSSINELKKQNKLLEKRIESLSTSLKNQQTSTAYWKHQTQTTKNGEISINGAKKAAQDFLKIYDSNLKVREVQNVMREIGEAIRTGKSMDDVQAKAYAIGQKIATEMLGEMNVETLDKAIAAENIANDLIFHATSDDYTSIGTFADKQRAKLDATKQQYKDKLKQQKSEDAMKLAEAIAAGRTRTAEAIERTKKHYEERIANDRARRNEKNAQRDYIRKIEKHAKALSDMLLKPTDKKHIVKPLQAPVASILSSINLESVIADKITNVDPKTGKYTEKYAKDENGKTVYEVDAVARRTEAFRKLRDAYEQIIKDGDADFTIDEDLLGEDGWLAALTSGELKLSSKPIRMMDSSELDMVWHVLKATENAVRTANKMFNAARFETVREAADAIRETNMNKSKGEFISPQLQKLLTVDMLTPESFFHMLGKPGDEIFRMMRDSQDKAIRIYEEAKNFTEDLLKKQSIRKLEKETHTVKLGQREATMTTAQIMELYLLMNREQARNHILSKNGGISLLEIDRKGLYKKNNTAPYRLITEADIAEAIKLLTPEQIAIAEALQKFNVEVLAKHGNEAANTVYGYDKFTDPNYWKITSDEQGIKRELGKTQGTITSVAGMGSAKALTPNASNPIMIGSIFDTFSNSVTEMSNYSAWLATMEDVNRIRNFRFRDEEGKVLETMMNVFGRVYGRGHGSMYLEKLMSDLANGVKSEQNFFGGLTGNFKANAVGGNLRVIIQQPTAIFRAMDMIDPQYLARASVRYDGKYVLKAWEEAMKYSAIATWKDWGFFDIHTGRQMKNVLFNADNAIEKINNTLMKPAGFADSIGWGWLWNACKAETKAKTNLTGEALLKATAIRFNEVVDHTQVVDGIMQRSQLMRASDNLTKMATSFMGEPTKQYNMMVSTIYDVATTHSKEAKQKLVRAGFALAVAGVINAVAQSIIDAARRGDRDKDYLENVLAQFIGDYSEAETAWDYIKAYADSNLADAFNPFNNIPYIKDIVSIFQGYDVVRTDTQLLSNLWNDTQKVYKSFQGKGTYSTANAIASLCGDLAALVGTPVNNIKKDVLGITKTMVRGFKNYEAEYALAKFEYNMSQNKSLFIDIAYDAMKTDEEMYNKIRADIIKQDKLGTSSQSTEEYLDAKLKDRMKAEPEAQKAAEEFAKSASSNTDEQEKLKNNYLNLSVKGTEEKEVADDYTLAIQKLTESNYYSQLGTIDKDGESINLKEKVDSAIYNTFNDTDWKTLNQIDSLPHVDASDYALYLAAAYVADQNGKGKTTNANLDTEEKRAGLKALVKDGQLTNKQAEELWSIVNTSKQSFNK